MTEGHCGPPRSGEFADLSIDVIGRDLDRLPARVSTSSRQNDGVAHPHTTGEAVTLIVEAPVMSG
jgi:hypothetical protein